MDLDGAFLVDNLTKHDILLGRGKQVDSWKGNVRFRELVAERSLAYYVCDNSKKRDDIARELLSVIRKDDGRFLRKVRQGPPTHSVGDQSSKWREITYTDTLKKVKQALRDAGAKSSMDADAIPARRSLKMPKTTLEIGERTELLEPIPFEQLSSLRGGPPLRPNPEHITGTFGGTWLLSGLSRNLSQVSDETCGNHHWARSMPFLLPHNDFWADLLRNGRQQNNCLPVPPPTLHTPLPMMERTGSTGTHRVESLLEHSPLVHLGLLQQSYPRLSNHGIVGAACTTDQRYFLQGSRHLVPETSTESLGQSRWDADVESSCCPASEDIDSLCPSPPSFDDITIPFPPPL